MGAPTLEEGNSMRVSRWEWLSRFFKLDATVQPKPKREKREPKEPPQRKWLVLGKWFEAATKSEARALAKKAFGFKERLPVGTVVKEMS